jgi:hypothetical protein
MEAMKIDKKRLQETALQGDLPPASLVQFGSKALHPAPNGSVVSRQTSFREQFLDVPIRQREPEIPTDRANNDLRFEVPPFE